MRKSENPTKESPAFWVSLVVMEICSDLAGTIATFLPMKTILILSAGKVPSFFPEFIVALGPLLASIFLLSLAGLIGFLSWALKAAVRKVDLNQTKGLQPKTHVGLTSFMQSGVHSSNNRSFPVAVGVSISASAVLVIFSSAFLGLTFLWVSISALVALSYVVWGGKTTNYVSGADKFSFSLSNWLKKSALWSVVLIALLTLLLSPPEFGSTAILIAAIFGRRLMIAIADLTPLLSPYAFQLIEKNSNPLLRSKLVNTPVLGNLPWPIDFIATAKGNLEIQRFFKRLDPDFSNFEIIGKVGRTTLTLVSNSPVNGSQIIVRIFGANHVSARNRELDLRRDPTTSFLFPASHCIEADTSGYPSIVIWPDDDHGKVDTNRQSQTKDAVHLQLNLEIDSLDTVVTETNQWHSAAAAAAEMLPPAFTEIVTSIQLLPGKHQTHCQEILSEAPRLFQCLEKVGNTVVPKIALTPPDVYISKTGRACFLGGVDWELGKPGSSWGKSPIYWETLCSIPLEPLENSTLMRKHILLNAKFHLLLKSLQAFDLKATVEEIESIKLLLAEIEEISM